MPLHLRSKISLESETASLNRIACVHKGKMKTMQHCELHKNPHDIIETFHSSPLAPPDLHKWLTSLAVAYKPRLINGEIQLASPNDVASG